jgi:hypothetical protein
MGINVIEDVAERMRIQAIFGEPGRPLLPHERVERSIARAMWAREQSGLSAFGPGYVGSVFQAVGQEFTGRLVDFGSALGSGVATFAPLGQAAGGAALALSAGPLGPVLGTAAVVVGVLDVLLGVDAFSARAERMSRIGPGVTATEQLIGVEGYRGLQAASLIGGAGLGGGLWAIRGVGVEAAPSRAVTPNLRDAALAVHNAADPIRLGRSSLPSLDYSLSC